MPISVDTLRKYLNKNFVETGSFIGDGIQTALDAGFEKVTSIEFYFPLVERCRKRFSEQNSVKIVRGSSMSELWHTIKDIGTEITFWLDAHYSGEGTSYSGKYCPVMEELEQISRHPIKTHVIMIDDRRLFGRKDRKYGIPFPGITEEMIIEKILEINPRYQISYEDGIIKNDVIVARVPKPKPPKNIPEEFKKKFTMGGVVSVKNMYFDQSSPPDRNNHTDERMRIWMKMARKKECPYYKNANKYLYEALDKYPIQNKTLCVFGSDKPWFEAIALVRGAQQVGVIEYRKIKFNFPRLTYWTCEEYYNMKTPPRYDCGFSISSFEHDGLGRYGDPINPEGDLMAMKNALEVIKPGGLLYLSVPVGKDTVVWNAHRIYGKYRFPKLVEGWEIVDSFGIGEMGIDVRWRNEDMYVYQPVFVLKKRG